MTKYYRVGRRAKSIDMRSSNRWDCMKLKPIQAEWIFISLFSSRLHWFRYLWNINQKLPVYTNYLRRLTFTEKKISRYTIAFLKELTYRNLKLHRAADNISLLSIISFTVQTFVFHLLLNAHRSILAELYFYVCLEMTEKLE